MTVESEVVEVVPVETEDRWVLPSASHSEMMVLNALQDRGIEDKNAIATVMGNIKQESKFNANICEGGARISYHHCRSGGYGLIQWTSSNRYHGLGRHANELGLIHQQQMPKSHSYSLNDSGRESSLPSKQTECPLASIWGKHIIGLAGAYMVTVLLTLINMLQDLLALRFPSHK